MRRVRPWLPLAVLLLPLAVWARAGGGENYVPSFDDSGDSDGGGDGIGILFRILIELAFRHPKVGVPLLIVATVGYLYYQKTNNPTARTQRAFVQRESEVRMQQAANVGDHWVRTLKSRDPAFEPNALYGRATKLFLQLQDAWFKRDLSPVRPMLSDATYERLKTQLALMEKQGIRDAIADLTVTDVTLIAADSNPYFDSVHLRIRARGRDTDVPSTMSDDDALARAQRTEVQSFVEAWTLVRKPGVQTKIGQDVFNGKCPNCGAPFNGGATNTCDFCKAIVNSGNYDWVLSEITQGVEYEPYKRDGGSLREVRAQDPALSTEALEDRASLVFWRWIDAHAMGEPRALAKLATPAYLQTLGAELEGVKRSGRVRSILECAVGAVNTISVEPDVNGRDEANVEVRWSARMTFETPGRKATGAVPPVNQRSVFVLSRKSGATTNAQNGMSTSRCPNCNAPLSETLTSTCDYCSAELSSGDRDWVLEDALTFEAWNARQWTRKQNRHRAVSNLNVIDVRERERLLAMMAAVAAADGEVDGKERQLLQLCATRWSVPWENVEYALSNGTQLFDRLVPRGSDEAEAFLRGVVSLALIDGKVDRKERQLLEVASRHLGIPEKLQPMLRA